MESIMKDPYFLEKGQLVMFSDGESSDYEVLFIASVTVSFNRIAAVVLWCHETGRAILVDSWDGSDYLVARPGDGIGFHHWLLNKGVIHEVDCFEWSQRPDYSYSPKCELSIPLGLRSVDE